MKFWIIAAASVVLAACGLTPPNELARTKDGIVDCRCAFQMCKHVSPDEYIYFNRPTEGQCQIGHLR